MIEEALTREGYTVNRVESAERAGALVLRERWDLAILDVEVSDGSGIELCRRIRREPGRRTLPVILLSGSGRPADKAQGLAAGADQYLAKPIAVREFLLWVRALLSRGAGGWPESDRIRDGDLELRPLARLVAWRDAAVPGLTSREFDLLLALVRARPRTLSQEELLRSLWRETGNAHALAVHVQTLRRKLGPQAASRIVTVRGVGYRFE